MLSSVKRLISRKLHRLLNPVTPDQLRKTLSNLCGTGNDILFVHASLSACGRFTSGPTDVINALDDCSNSLGFPTHTYLYPTEINEAAPVFNPETAISQTGFLTELFRQHKDSERSIHSTHSLAMIGEKKRYICNSHYKNNTPCGAGTPYDRLIDERASILMFGVSFHTYTLFHTAEDASGSAYAYEEGTRDRLRVIDETGVEQECISRRQSRVPRRFREAGDLLEKKGLVTRAPLGGGALLYVPDCAKVHDFCVEHLRKTPDFLYESCKEELT